MLEILTAAAATGLSGGLSPGPLLALVLAETLARGRAAGLAVAASPLITDGPIIAAAVVLHGRIESSQSALGVVNLAGGALLASYGVSGLRAGSPEITSVTVRSRVLGSLGKGVAVNLLNPNPYLFWLTVGVPMLLRAAELGYGVAISFLAVFYFGLVGSKVVLAILVARSRAVLRGRGYLWTNRALAVALLVFAAIFLREGLLRLMHSS